jgi:hypothetical protein
MSRARSASGATPGEDSFLDVIANLVGILIILVMVVGAQAKSSWEKAAISEAGSERTQELQASAEKAQHKSRNMRVDNVRLEMQLRAEQSAEQQLRDERNQIQLVTVQLEQEVENLEVQANSEQRVSAEQNARLHQLNQQLAELNFALTKSQEPQVVEETIDHYPTPIARTVFGDEIHFRLNRGKLAFLPMNELVSLVKADFQLKARGLGDADVATETVGPVDDFRMQYTFKKYMIERKTANMSVRQQAAAITEFQVIPARDDLGEPIEFHLAEGSATRRLLDRMEPQKTTVSIWVYPDSYAEFNQLKTWLSKRGFLVAAWPLPAGRPIAGSPQGYQSAAQ